MKPLRIVLPVFAICLTLTGLAALIPFRSSIRLHTTGGLYALGMRHSLKKELFP